MAITIKRLPAVTQRVQEDLASVGLGPTPVKPKITPKITPTGRMRLSKKVLSGHVLEEEILSLLTKCHTSQNARGRLIGFSKIEPTGDISLFIKQELGLK